MGARNESVFNGTHSESRQFTSSLYLAFTIFQFPVASAQSGLSPSSSCVSCCVYCGINVRLNRLSLVCCYCYSIQFQVADANVGRGSSRPRPGRCCFYFFLFLLVVIFFFFYFKLCCISFYFFPIDVSDVLNALPLGPSASTASADVAAPPPPSPPSPRATAANGKEIGNQKRPGGTSPHSTHWQYSANVISTKCGALWLAWPTPPPPPHSQLFLTALQVEWHDAVASLVDLHSDSTAQSWHLVTPFFFSISILLASSNNKSVGWWVAPQSAINFAFMVPSSLHLRIWAVWCTVH